MKSFSAKGAVVVLGFALTAHAAHAQQLYGPNTSPNQHVGYRGAPTTDTDQSRLVRPTARTAGTRYVAAGNRQQPGNLDPELVREPNANEPTPAQGPIPGQQNASEESLSAPGNSPIQPPAPKGLWDDYGHESDGSSGCDSGNCNDWLGGCGSCGTNWYGGLGGLIMTRDRVNDRWLSYDDNNSSVHALTTNQAHMQWAGGFEARLGRMLNCGQNAIEASYWGLFPGETSSFFNVPDPLNLTLRSTLDFSLLSINGGADLANLPVNDATMHHVNFQNEFHNVEINMLGFCGSTCMNGGCGGFATGMGGGLLGGGAPGAFGGMGNTYACGSPLQFSWMGGVRFFRFDEAFNYCAMSAIDSLSYDINVKNNLIGFQIGGRLDYWVNPCWRFYAGSKLGLYGNHVSHDQRIYNSNGDAVVDVAASPFLGQAYNVHSTRETVAFLGELDLGTSYQLSRNWSVYGGYRGIAATGVALTTNQIPTFFGDLNDARSIDSNGSLILHGAYAGVSFAW